MGDRGVHRSLPKTHSIQTHPNRDIYKLRSNYKSRPKHVLLLPRCSSEIPKKRQLLLAVISFPPRKKKNSTKTPTTIPGKLLRIQIFHGYHALLPHAPPNTEKRCVLTLVIPPPPPPPPRKNYQRPYKNIRKTQRSQTPFFA